MRLPRDLSGPDLAQALGALGYRVTRQIGSHLRLTTLNTGNIILQSRNTTPSALGRSQQFWSTLLGISRRREMILSHACFVRSDKDGPPLPRVCVAGD
jgi:predicted RNA binding protein YcfA (HicA-like mRNA interferase family)